MVRQMAVLGVLMLPVIGCTSNASPGATREAAGPPASAPAGGSPPLTSRVAAGTATPGPTTSSGGATTSAAATGPSTSPPEPSSEPIAPSRATTSSPPATPPATSTSVVPTEPLVLRGDGVGTHRLGGAAAAVLETLVGRLGAPTSDISSQFPIESAELGMWTTPDIDEGFVAPLAHEVCWPVGFCATFGGETAEALTLRGWQYHRPADTAGLGALATAEGITVGSRWADHVTVITVEPGGCYTTGYGRTNDGIRLELLGGTWSRTDDEGGYVPLLPDPASVEIEVDAMAAGQLVNHLTYDC